MDYYDISPLISEKIAVFPGDKNFQRIVSLDIHKGHLELSSIASTLHLGAHVDAPIHYHADGESISERSLNYYLGPCQVIEVPKSTMLINTEVIKNIPILAERILFKTLSFPDPNHWSENFTALMPETIHFLAKKKVILVGIDTPSIDPAESKTLDSHKAIFQHNMAILEGIVLNEVPEGLYHLIALPLKIKDADASPVRAILLKF